MTTPKRIRDTAIALAKTTAHAITVYWQTRDDTTVLALLVTLGSWKEVAVAFDTDINGLNRYLRGHAKELSDATWEYLFVNPTHLRVVLDVMPENEEWLNLPGRLFDLVNILRDCEVGTSLDLDRVRLLLEAYAEYSPVGVVGALIDLSERVDELELQKSVFCMQAALLANYYEEDLRSQVVVSLRQGLQELLHTGTPGMLSEILTSRLDSQIIGLPRSVSLTLARNAKVFTIPDLYQRTGSECELRGVPNIGLSAVGEVQEALKRIHFPALPKNNRCR